MWANCLKMRVIYVMLGLAIAGLSTMVVVAEEWETGDDIAGVGEITQVYPDDTVSNRTNLHYGETDSEETAQFEIDVDDATDIDLCTPSDPEITDDAGLEETDTDWTCTPTGAGEIDDEGFCTTFTPGDGIHAGIEIKCEVFEGHSLSYDYGNYDDSVEVEWSGTLDTFKVGVKMDPDNHKYWESDTGTEEKHALHASISKLGLSTGWSGYTSAPGQNTKSGDLAKKDLTWKAIAETSTGPVGGIMGSIEYAPLIECEGGLRLIADTIGFSRGVLGTLASIIEGMPIPYIDALVNIFVDTTGTKTHWKVQLLGSSAIESISSKSIGSSEDYVGVLHLNGVDDYDLSSLNISGTTVTADEDDVVEGSVDLEALAETVDDSHVSEAYAQVYIFEHGWVKYGSSKPSYTAYSP